MLCSVQTLLVIGQHDSYIKNHTLPEGAAQVGGLHARFANGVAASVAGHRQAAGRQVGRKVLRTR